MRSRRRLFALLVGALLTVAAVGAWTATSLGAAAPPDDLTAARFEFVIDGRSIASFAELPGVTSGYEIDSSSRMAAACRPR